METHMHQRSMLDQPKTSMTCSCGEKHFEILLCPEHANTQDSHIVGFQCVECEAVLMTITDSTYVEDENTVH